MLRFLVLDTVYHGVLALKESENDLLPMIHRLWPPLVNRLNDKDQVTNCNYYYYYLLYYYYINNNINSEINFSLYTIVFLLS